MVLPEGRGTDPPSETGSSGMRNNGLFNRRHARLLFQKTHRNEERKVSISARYL